LAIDGVNNIRVSENLSVSRCKFIANVPISYLRSWVAGDLRPKAKMVVILGRGQRLDSSRQVLRGLRYRSKWKILSDGKGWRRERVDSGDKEERKCGKGRLLWKAAGAKDFRLTSKRIVVASESW
jgi:hypothetical protein